MSAAGRLCRFAFLTALLTSDISACPFAETGESGEKAFAAGCLVKIDGKMLVVRHRFNGKLGLPAGYSDGSESARCTAYRETLEETGLNVAVHDLLKEFDNGFRLYHCSVPGSVSSSDSVAVPPSGIAEISEIIWLDPDSAPDKHWRFPEQHPTVRSLFNELDSD